MKKYPVNKIEWEPLREKYPGVEGKINEMRFVEDQQESPYSLYESYLPQLEKYQNSVLAPKWKALLRAAILEAHSQELESKPLHSDYEPVKGSGVVGENNRIIWASGEVGSERKETVDNAWNKDWFVPKQKESAMEYDYIETEGLEAMKEEIATKLQEGWELDGPTTPFHYTVSQHNDWFPRQKYLQRLRMASMPKPMCAGEAVEGAVYCNTCYWLRNKPCPSECDWRPIL